MKNKCKDCILKISKFCICNGTPEEVIGNIDKCDYYFPKSNSFTYNEGFIIGYIEALSRTKEGGKQ